MFSSISDHHQISPSLPNILLPPPRPQLNFDRKWKPHLETAPNCPRCASSNTKFCYYNNYSFSQPRYFCKSCRRYWTKGGSLRNVPVGGGCRKSRRPKSAKSVLHHQQTTTTSETDQPREFDESNETSGIDLAAVFARFLNTSNPVPPESLDPIGNSEYLFDGISDIFDEKVEEMSVDELWQETEDMAFPSWNQELNCLGYNYNYNYNYNVNELKISESDQYCQVGDNWSSSFDAAAGFEVLSNSNP